MTAYSDFFLLPHLKDLSPQHVVVSNSKATWAAYNDTQYHVVTLILEAYNNVMFFLIQSAFPPVPAVPLPKIFPRCFPSDAWIEISNSDSGLCQRLTRY